MYKIFTKIEKSRVFFNIVLLAIIMNAFLIGVQATIKNELVDDVQYIILFVFIVEIIIRWLARDSVISFIKNPWNWFDLIIVSISLIPDSLFLDASSISALRVIRVFRVLRLFKAFPELQLMVKVLLRSFKSVLYAGALLLVFMYIYSIIGVILFKGSTTVVTAHSDFIDPFGSISEAFFSLFRVTTGEDWTDLRYDMMTSISGGASLLVINIYYISWYILSAFILMNIVFGAIITNYERIYSESKGDKNESLDLLNKISILESKIDKLIDK